MGPLTLRLQAAASVVRWASCQRNWRIWTTSKLLFLRPRPPCHRSLLITFTNSSAVRITTAAYLLTVFKGYISHVMLVTPRRFRCVRAPAAAIAPLFRVHARQRKTGTTTTSCMDKSIAVIEHKGGETWQSKMHSGTMMIANWNGCKMRRWITTSRCSWVLAGTQTCTYGYMFKQYGWTTVMTSKGCKHNSLMRYSLSTPDGQQFKDGCSL